MHYQSTTGRIMRIQFDSCTKDFVEDIAFSSKALKRIQYKVLKLDKQNMRGMSVHPLINLRLVLQTVQKRLGLWQSSKVERQVKNLGRKMSEKNEYIPQHIIVGICAIIQLRWMNFIPICTDAQSFDEWVKRISATGSSSKKDKRTLKERKLFQLSLRRSPDCCPCLSNQA